MIAWGLWFFLALPFFLLDGWLASRSVPGLDLTLAFCLYLALFARPQSLPGLLVVAGLARSVVLDGDAAVHVLALGVPVAVLVPLRTLLSRHHPAWQGLASAFLAWTEPHMGGLLARISQQPAPDETAATVVSILAATVLVPLATWLLRRLPPLRFFAERSE